MEKQKKTKEEKFDEVLQSSEFEKLNNEVVRYVMEDDFFDFALSSYDKLAKKLCSKYNEDVNVKVKQELIDWVALSRKAMYEEDYFNEDFAKKGFLICGNTGCGKTFTMQIFVRLLKILLVPFKQNGEKRTINPYTISARDISYGFAEYGYNFIREIREKRVLFIDDLGAEPISSNFGNKASAVSEILMYRAENNLLTFATTNYTTLGDLYDDRVISRCHSLFNKIVIRDNDLRVMNYFSNVTKVSFNKKK